MSNSTDLKTMLDLSPWTCRMNYGDYVNGNGFKWTVMAIDLHDKSKLNTICLLINSTPFNNITPLLSKIWCILRLSGSKVKDYPEHDLNAPVTIVSLSGRDVRIVQGYVASPADGLIVRISNIIHLNQDDEKNLEGFVQIARWLLAEPCKGPPSHD
ncbi:hypothetical protein F4810DRAFT_705973 [Camillea tinctor]|nr:hypothetical protein F4810DRAFT_705973 [Camillea tinctor]